jgi:hypothetical protein
MCGSPRVQDADPVPRANLGQHPSTQPLPALREPATLRIRQPQAPADELTSKGPVFLDQIGDDVLLLAIQPASREQSDRMRDP